MVGCAGSEKHAERVGEARGVILAMEMVLGEQD